MSIETLKHRLLGGLKLGGGGGGLFERLLLQNTNMDQFVT